MRRHARPSGRDADPRRTIPLQSAAWQRLRAAVLAKQPLCVHCSKLGRATVATDVDHRDGDPSNNETENLQPMCHSCHSRKTGRERAGHSGEFGCDASGQPLDPDHHWNQR